MQSQVKMVQDQRQGKGGLEQVECLLTGIRPVPRHVLASQTSKRNCHIRVVDNKSPVKVRKAQEQLNVLNATRRWPILNNFNFSAIHVNAIQVNDESQELDSIDTKLAFFNFGKYIGSAEMSQNFANMIGMLGRVVGINEDVVQVYYNKYVQHVLEGVIHEALE